MDDTSFGDDGLFCEFAYWVDFERRLVEVEGVTRGTAEVPFSDLEPGLFRKMNEDYWNHQEELENIEIAKRLAKAKAEKARKEELVQAHQASSGVVGTPERVRGVNDDEGRAAFTLGSPLEVEVHPVLSSPDDGDDRAESRGSDDGVEIRQTAELVYEKGPEEISLPLSDSDSETTDSHPHLALDANVVKDENTSLSHWSLNLVLRNSPLPISDDVERTSGQAAYEARWPEVITLAEAPEDIALPASDDGSQTNENHADLVHAEARLPTHSPTGIAPENISLPPSDTGSCTSEMNADVPCHQAQCVNSTTPHSTLLAVTLRFSEDVSHSIDVDTDSLKPEARWPRHIAFAPAPQDVPLPASNAGSDTTDSDSLRLERPTAPQLEPRCRTVYSEQETDREMTRPTGTLQERMSQGNGKFRRGDIPFITRIRKPPPPPVLAGKEELPDRIADVYLEDELRAYEYNNSAWEGYSDRQAPLSEEPEDIPLPTSRPDSGEEDEESIALPSPTYISLERDLAISSLRQLISDLNLPTTPDRGQTFAEMIPVHLPPDDGEIARGFQESAHARAEELRAELEADEQDEEDSSEGEADVEEVELAYEEDAQFEGEDGDEEWYDEDGEQCGDEEWDEEEGEDDDDESESVRRPCPPLDLPPNWLEIAEAIAAKAEWRKLAPEMEETPEEEEHTLTMERWRAREGIQWRLNRGYTSE